MAPQVKLHSSPVIEARTPNQAGGPFTLWEGPSKVYDHGKMTIVIRSRIMKTIPAGQFKAQCLALIDDIHEHGGEVVITKRGKPRAKLVPIAETKRESIFGFLKGRARVAGDIVSPITERWEWDQDVFPPSAPEQGRDREKIKPERSGRARRRA
jgi:prevent-host-death family protein